MNWQAFRHSRKAIGLTVAAGTALVGFGASHTTAIAQADTDNTQAASNSVSVSILSPFQSTAFEGSKKIEVSAFYQAVQGGGIQTIELDIDGVKAATKQLDNPEIKGIISFLVDPTTLSTGDHRVAIRVVTSDSNEATATSSFHYTGDSGAPNVGNIDAVNPAAPVLTINGLVENQKVNGIVAIKVNVSDPSGKSPYVSLFVDNVFKTLRNYGPYTFDWDTRSVKNGLHTISVSGFSDETQIGKSQALHIFVNNVMGDTGIESISDTVAPPTAKADVNSPVTPAPVITTAAQPKITATPPSSDSVASAPTSDAALISDHGTAEHSQGHMPTRLASVNFENAGIDAETILNAPFLSHKAPVTPDEIKPKTSATLVAATMPAAPEYSHAANQMASARTDSDDLNAQTLLAAPFLHAQTAPPHASNLTQITVAPVTIHLDPPIVAVAKQVPDAPVVIASAMIRTDLTVGEPDMPTVAAPSVSARIASPQMAMPKVEVKVQSPAQSFQMASAKIDSSTPSLGALMLKTPKMVRQHQPIASKPIASKPIADKPIADMSGVAHHTVDVFSKDVTERVRGSYVLVMDDHAVKLDQPLQDRDSILCAPLREIFESEGGVIDWSAKTKEVRAVTSTRDIRLKIGSRTATVNGEATSLKTAPYISKSRTMIPVGFLPLALNVSVNYDPATGHVEINSKG